MLGGSTLGIGVTMFLRDQFSAPSARVRASAQQTQQEFLRMQEAQLRSQRNMYAGLAIGGVMALRGMGRMVKRAAAFSYEMEFVKSITQATADEQIRLAGVAKSLGRETMFYPQAIAEGMRFMAMAGMTAREVESNIRGAVTLAGATKSELGGKGGAADIMTNVMKQFKIGFEYTNDVANILAYAVTRANTNLFDLGEALKYAGSTSMDLNISLGESTAMVMALGNAGMQGSMAGVAMENSMRYMTRAFSTFGSGTSQRALAELGLTVKDVTDEAGNLLTMTEVMKKFGQAIVSVGSNVERQAILQAVFGVRGKRAASLFLRNLLEFEKFTGKVSAVQGDYAANILGDMMSTLQGYMFKLGSAWQAMWVSFTERVGPIFIWIMKGLVKALAFFERVFDKKILGGFFATGIAGFLVLKTVTFAYKTVVAGLRLMHMTAGTSATTMAGQTVASYASMTAAAKTYGATAVIAGAAGRTATWGYNPMLFRGKGGYWMRNAAGGMKMSRTAKGMKTVARGAWGGVGRVGARAMGFGGAAFLGRGMVTGALSRIVGIFGGPLGIALSFILPGLIGGVIAMIKRNKESTEANTKGLEEANRAKLRTEMQYSRVGHMIRFQDLKTPELTTIGQTAVGQQQRNLDTETLGKLAKQLEILLGDKQVQPINIYIDNELAIQKLLDRNIADSLSVLQ